MMRFQGSAMHNERGNKISLRPTPVWAAILLTVLAISPAYSETRGATLAVATADSSEKSKQAADFVADGDGDQEEINLAIESLPEVGGKVQLMEGTYDIKKVSGELGGVLIKRSNVELAGMGQATKLIQAASQETNVIRIIGDNVGNITIRDLYVDANRDENPLGEGDPNVSHGRFEFCGIKAFCARPGGGCDIEHYNITVMNCTILNARRLGIMLEGRNMNVINNTIGNAMSDSVEILNGPGEIRGNYFEITGRTHVACGADRGNSILMTNNIVHVRETGDIDIGFRTWSNSRRQVVADNVLIVDKGGQCGTAMDIRGDGAVVTGNTVESLNDERLPMWITGGNTLVTGNLLRNVTLVINDKSEKGLPIVVNNNILHNSEIDHQKGILLTSTEEK
ncbi:MAG: right-handed parallel beta-helix repeat-containing protein [Candidatus Omnitrophica bacterium]|nr:right-handed parallel beta-helix repeat-containing protein [Candidatus Omnitrophota bacterium]MCB9782735.1 right-handed parallel beta-helix repeat-containing protein [Candidatus Omnitrophota bacterium]